MNKKNELEFANAPNMLTGLRILCVPVVVFYLFKATTDGDLVAFIVFIAASITDWIDGYVARATQAVTVYGKLLDPLADKFLVVCTLVALLYLGRIGPSIVMVLVCRELAITGLRALASAEGLILSASDSGKWKTAFQMTAIPMLILNHDLLGLPIARIGLVCIYFSIGLSLWSAKDYVWSFFQELKNRKAQKQK